VFSAETGGADDGPADEEESGRLISVLVLNIAKGGRVSRKSECRFERGIQDVFVPS